MEKKKAKSDKPANIKKENICLLCASLVLLVVQFVVIWNAVFRTAWDPGAVWYGAHFVELGDQDGINSMAYYFSVYPNNLLLVWIYSIVLKLNDGIGTPIANGTMLLALFQCIFVTGAGACLYKTVRHSRIRKLLGLHMDFISFWAVVGVDYDSVFRFYRYYFPGFSFLALCEIKRDRVCKEKMCIAVSYVFPVLHRF